MGTAESYREDARRLRESGVPELMRFAPGYELIADAVEHGVTCLCGRRMTARSAGVYVCEFGCWTRVDLLDLDAS